MCVYVCVYVYIYIYTIFFYVATEKLFDHIIFKVCVCVFCFRVLSNISKVFYIYPPLDSILEFIYPHPTF